MIFENAPRTAIRMPLQGFAGCMLLLLIQEHLNVREASSAHSVKALILLMVLGTLFSLEALIRSNQELQESSVSLWLSCDAF